MYGIERTLATLLPDLRAGGRPAELLSLIGQADDSSAVGDVCAALGVPVHYVRVTRGAHPADLRNIWRALGRSRPALVHVHGYKATTLVGSLAHLRRIPVVATVHSEVASAPEVAKNLRVESHVLRRLPHIVAVSSGVATDVVRRGVPHERVQVIRNGIVDPGLTPWRGDAPVSAVIVGRLVEPKNTHIALQAVARLAQRNIIVQLVVAGDGPERAALDRLTQDLGIGGQVRFVGFASNVAELLEPNAIFLMPSRSEGIPIALLEAMAHGLPIIASRVGGIPEVVDDQREALLIPADDVDALVNALATLVDSTDRARQLGDAARARYEREFRASAMCARYEQVYTTVLGAP